MIMTTLFLTAEEQKLFEALPGSLKEGWQAKEETRQFTDSQQKASIRLHLLRLEDPKMLQFVEEAKSKESVDDVAALINDTDLSGVSERELAKLFFALGPAPLGQIISSMLPEAKTDKDLEEIVAITTIRHFLLSSLTHTAAL